MKRPDFQFSFLVAGFAAAMAVSGAGAADKPDNVQLSRIYENLTTRHEQVLDRQQATRARLAELEAILHRYTIDEATLDQAVQISEEELAELRRLIEQLRAEVAAKAAELNLAPENIPEELLRKRVEREEITQEAQRLAMMMAAQDESESELASAVALSDRTSVPFMLTGGNIAPFATPYFDYTLMKVRLPDRRVVERRRYHRADDAGPAAAAVEPGGVLYDLVNSPNFDRAQSYVTFWVCQDSIDAFYKVVQFCKENRLTYNWSPDVDEPWIASDDDAPVEAWGYQSE